MGDSTEGRISTTGRSGGSGTWMSPERILADRNGRTFADDAYAFGCLGYYVSSQPFALLLLDPN
jgi:hypothetical protein